MLLFRSTIRPICLLLCTCDFQPRDTGRPARVAQDRSGNVYTFGDVNQVEATRFFTIPILRADPDKAEGSFSGSYRGEDQRNRLIVDSVSGTSRRVLPNQNFEIVNWFEPAIKASDGSDHLIDPAASGEAARTVPSGLYAAVVKRPGKGDKDPARYDVLLGRFETGQQAWIATGLAGVESLWITPKHRLGMVAATAQGGVYRLYDPENFRQQLESKLKL
jgi:hypothetical protein